MAVPFFSLKPFIWTKSADRFLEPVKLMLRKHSRIRTLIDHAKCGSTSLAIRSPDWSSVLRSS